jgi:catechol 2,3-dioxygenase-like lactoylglutathione lyase family enzyme
MYIAEDPPPLAASHLRIARPSRDLARTERFWVSGLGLRVLERIQPRAEDEHELVMLGWPGAAWHLELVSDPDGQTPPAPTEEDLMVLYLGQPAGDRLIARLAGAGGRLVPASNPYWDRWGVTIADPDSYRLVLSHRRWR